MKRIVQLFMLFSATLFVACSEENIGPMDWTDKVPIQISIEQTRANDTSFEAGDQIGLYVVGGANNTLLSAGNHVDNMCFELSEGWTETWTPRATIYWIDQNTNLDMYAYYPYGTPTDVNAYPFSVLSDQSSEDNYFASDFLWGKRTNAAPTTNSVAISTEHLFSNALIYIIAGEGVTEEELAASNIEVRVCNTKLGAEIDLATGSVEAVGSTSDIAPWYTGSYYRAMIVPQTVSSNNELVNITVGDEEYTYSTDMTFESGTRHKITVTISRATTPDTPTTTDKLSVNFTIEEWIDDNNDYGGNAVKREEESTTSKDFAVTFSNKTPISADATISVVDANKQNMVWGAFTFTASLLVEQDWATGTISTLTPEEFATKEINSLMEYGALYTTFYYNQESGGYLLSESGNTIACSAFDGWSSPSQKVYLAIVGINKQGVDLDAGTDSSTLSTDINIFEVEMMPQPLVKLSKYAATVDATAGTLTLNTTVKNPYKNGTITANVTNTTYWEEEWITATHNNGTLTITYNANTSTESRTAEITVTYTYTDIVYDWETEIPFNTALTIEQKGI